MKVHICGHIITVILTAICNTSKKFAMCDTCKNDKRFSKGRFTSKPIVPGGMS